MQIKREGIFVSFLSIIEQAQSGMILCCAVGSKLVRRILYVPLAAICKFFSSLYRYMGKGCDRLFAFLAKWTEQKKKKKGTIGSKTEKEKKNRNSAGRISFLCIGIFLVLVLSVQMVRLYQKNEALVQTEQTKQNELSEQEDKQKELEEQEQYIQSDEYKEKVAKDKLGLVYDNETIFREK